MSRSRLALLKCDFDRICCHRFEASSDFRRKFRGYMMETSGSLKILLGRQAILDRGLIPPQQVPRHSQAEYSIILPGVIGASMEMAFLGKT
jgi:hypothetical protein